MSDDRWWQVEDIFHRAVELGREARSAYLEKACAGDLSLRREVEALLQHQKEDGNTFAGPGSDAPPEAIAHYQILGKLGEGGMGAVYRARDTKLGRDVAIKVLPNSFAEDAGRIARFRLEAKVLAALNHPNIAQIYGIEERALVMELIQGEMIQRPLPLETALKYARQIAEALEATHEKGIVHRDLKPANILVTPDGVVKLLDFGLAAITQASTPGEALVSPTITIEATRRGVIIGTAAYMSPEQAAGRPVDKRADIWSFGVVVWEMLTGRRMFQGETVAQTLADVINAPIEFDRLPRGTPRGIQSLLQRCLERDVKNRLRDIGEARIAIEGALAGEAEPVERFAGAGGRMWPGWCAAAVMTAVLAPFAFLHLREKPPAAATPLRFPILAPENATLGSLLNVSPDGQKVAFMANFRLWVHFFESGETRDLTEINGTPFWSPDSRFIGYPFARKVRKIAATGGPSQAVTDYQGLWGAGAWNKDDVIVFSNRVGLYRVPAGGGVAVQITAVDPAREVLHYAPSFLPDGKHFVYTRRLRDPKQSAVCLGSVDETPDKQTCQPLTHAYWGARYAPSADRDSGYLLFVRNETLMAQPFDNRRLALTGQPAPLAEQIGDGRAFSVSNNGVLVYRRNELSMQLTWFDREGRNLGTAGDPDSYRAVSLSPDQTHAALLKGGVDQASSIWLMDLGRGTSNILSFGPESDTSPVWSRDGSHIVFSSNREGTFNVYGWAVNGAKSAEALLQSNEHKFATSWSTDGRFLLYTVFDAKTKNDIWVLPMQGEKKPVAFLVTEFNEASARFSPDGNWVAYASDESGRSEVYVRRFTLNTLIKTGDSGGKWLISGTSGDLPAWRSDGRELFYQRLDGTLMAVEIDTSPAFRAGVPRPLALRTEMDRGLLWAPSDDGKRFLMLLDKSKQEPYTVVLNWQVGLKK
jgi:Tol biopolymer transport system component/predicted Ser/Thr protein kinase